MPNGPMGFLGGKFALYSLGVKMKISTAPGGEVDYSCLPMIRQSRGKGVGIMADVVLEVAVVS